MVQVLGREVTGEMIFVCSWAALFGMVSAAAGLAAEANRITVDQVEHISPSRCIFPSDPAVAVLGFIAAYAIATAQVIFWVTSGFSACIRLGPHQQSDTAWIRALICCIVSWLASITAFTKLLLGSILSNPVNNSLSGDGSSSCYFVPRGVFSGGAVLSLAGVVFGIIHYLLLNINNNDNNNSK